MVWLAFWSAYFLLSADLGRRELPGDPLNIILLLVVAGLAGSKLYHLLERPAEFFSDPLGLFFSSYGFAWFGGLLGGLSFGGNGHLPSIDHGITSRFAPRRSYQPRTVSPG